MDAMADDRFAETLESGHRFAHEVLRNYSFYVNSAADQRMDLLRAAHPLKVEDGHLLLEAGYACRDVVLVGRGRIRTYIAGESGREVTLYYVHAGESCPVNLGAAMMGIGAFADACASGELVGATIPALDFRAIGRRNAAVHEYAFSATMLRLYASPLPLVVAVNGHAIAGGCVLALMADLRLMVEEDDAKIGLNEVQLGIGLPASVVEPLRATVPAASLGPIALQGRLFNSAEAQALSL